MTLSEHYKFHSRKSMRPYLKLCLILVLFISVFQTLASYSNTATGTQSTQVAKWSLFINDEEITSNTSSLSQDIYLINSADETTELDENDECYFDIIINPSTTEVSITYSIQLNLSTNSNLPIGTTILKYEKYTGSEETLASTKNVNSSTVSIGESIDLDVSRTALDNTSIRKYRIFCKMPESFETEENQEYTVTPTIIVQQTH